MEYINTVLGLAVLSGPLWLIALMVPVSLVVAFSVAKRFHHVGSRIGVGVSVLFAFFLVLFGDEIAGRMYLNHLCETEAGVKVYQTVELPAEYWDAGGEAIFVKDNGDIDRHIIGDRFEGHWVTSPFLKFPIEIDERQWKFVDNETNTLLGEKISYWWHGGWLESLSPSPKRGASCRDYQMEKYGNAEFIRRERHIERTLVLNFLKISNSGQ